MTRETVPRDRHKSRMIETAVTILANEGLAAVQARRIAQDCGCSVGTLYNTFDGLDDLIVQANARTLDILHERLMAAAPDGTSAGGKDRVMALALAYMNFAMTHQRPWRAIFEHRPAEDWAVPAWYIAKQNNLYSILEGALAEKVPDSAARNRGARALFAAVHGIVTLAMDHKVGEGAQSDELEAQVRFVVAAATDALAREV